MAVQFGDMVGPLYDSATIPAHAAATATEIIPVFRAFKAGRIRSVTVVPGAAATGDNTNRTNINLIKYTAAAAPVGTEVANLDYATGTDAVLMKAATLYAPTTPAEFSAGEEFAIQLEKVATGLALGSMRIVVEYDLAHS